MKSIFSSIKNFRLAASLTLGLCVGNIAWGAPLLQSIDVSPNPLPLGHNFLIVVSASPDVTQVTATVDFHPGASLSMEIPLTKQGPIWTGTGFVPSDIGLRPHKDEAKVKVLLLGAGKRDEAVIHVDVSASLAPVSAVFAAGILTVTGDDLDNTFTVGRDVAGTLLVNGGALPITGGVPTITNTSLVRIFGLKGNDVLLVDDSNGRMPPANLFGGEGDDTLTGSASDDVLDGGPGNDILFGRDGNDRLMGGPGNDTLIGGRGTDEIFGGDGDDQIVWNPGDGSDLVEGENGVDTLVFNGSNIGEEVDLSAVGQRLRFFRNVANITMDCAGVERVVFHALSGVDQVTVNNLAGTQVAQVLVDLSSSAASGDGQADTIIINGSAADDHITLTASGSEVSVAGLSAAVSVIGAEQGLDKLVINALGGNDSVDFVGSTTNQFVDLSANGSQLHFFSSEVNILVDCSGAEQVGFQAQGGAEHVTVNDLTGTTVTNVSINLFGTTPGSGDGVAQTVTINGTVGDDHITVSGSAAGVNVLGLSAAVKIVGAEPALDNLVINALAGKDAIDASALPAGVIALTLNGGSGDDLLVGSRGDDLLIGGSGNDVVFGGAGNDTFIWNPGDGSDILEGEAGQDSLIFNGANIAETVDLSANGQRLRFFRNVANITMDCSGVEFVQFNALSGADAITINDLTGTGVTAVKLDLASPRDSGLGDNVADTVIVNGTTNADNVAIAGTSAGVSVTGLSATVSIVGSDPTLDQLIVNVLAGDDVVVASDLQSGVINLTVNGGPGADLLIGSHGADVLLGGEGDDVLLGGPGFDILDGGPGDNVIIQD